MADTNRLNSADSPRRVYLTLALVMVLLIGTMAYVWQVGDRMGRTHPQQIDGIMLLKLEMTAAHLWFEEILAGDRHESIDRVRRHLDEADWYTRALLEGGENSEWVFAPLSDPKAREEVRGLRRDLAQFRQLTEQRYKAQTTSASGTQIDQRQDAMFEEVLRHADGVESQIQRAHRGELKTFHLLQVLLIAFSLVLAAFMVRVFHRYAVGREQVEGQLRDYAETLASANKALEQSNLAVQAATRAKSEFLANMSHEIRTPMTAILGFAEILRTEGDLSKAPPERLEAIDTMTRNGEYLLDLINDILDLSQIEAGKLDVERTICSPSQIVFEVLALMRVRADAKNLPLAAEFDGKIPESIQTDPIRLRQILINLVGNAVKFTEVGGIRVVARLFDGDTAESRMEFEVRDTGIGISEEQMPGLFQPFSQVDSSATRKFGGTGLGLAISKRLVQRLGGDLTVISVPGKGSTFTLTVATGSLEGVRLLDNPTQTCPQVEQLDKPSVPRRAPLDCRILLAEDGVDNQRLIAFLLKKAGAEVTVAENGQVAIDYVHSTEVEGDRYDLILMDMQMPVLDGYDATRKLRAEGYRGPIIALTAHAMKEDRRRCLEAGCDEYLSKPVDRERLIQMVCTHLSSPEVGNPR